MRLSGVTLARQALLGPLAVSQGLWSEPQPHSIHSVVTYYALTARQETVICGFP